MVVCTLFYIDVISSFHLSEEKLQIPFPFIVLQKENINTIQLHSAEVELCTAVWMVVFCFKFWLVRRRGRENVRSVRRRGREEVHSVRRRGRE